MAFSHAFVRLPDTRITTGCLRDLTALPVRFAQVREDARLDCALLEMIRKQSPTRRLRVRMTASGGCTALNLAQTVPGIALELVDANPAQLDLCRLKFHLLTHAHPATRLMLLGHNPASFDARVEQLSRHMNAAGLDYDALGPLSAIARFGLDHAGRFDQLFQWFRQICFLHPKPHSDKSVRAAFRHVFAIDHLLHLFGAEATQNPRIPFHDHFANRVKLARNEPDAAANPYLQQILHGRFVSGARFPWLRQSGNPITLPVISYTHADWATRLHVEPEGQTDYLQLSNVLDWLSADAAGTLLQHAYRVLAPGGVCLIRQLNSSLDIPALAPDLPWMDARPWVRRERTFLYSDIHLIRKPLPRCGGGTTCT